MTDNEKELSQKTTHKAGAKRSLASRIVIVTLGTLLGLGVALALVIGFALTMAYPNLPELDSITSYKPKMPLRIFSADNVLIGEFGEERRNVVRFDQIPDIMKKRFSRSKMIAFTNTAVLIIWVSHVQPCTI
jgi:penicillin-binding protein 1A